MRGVGGVCGLVGHKRRRLSRKSTLRLHYVQKPIGYERFELARDADAFSLTSDFDFTDRGGRVQLAATLRTTARLHADVRSTPPARATASSNVDSDVRMDGATAIVRRRTHGVARRR
mgnify:CR=1 FL=1